MYKTLMKKLKNKDSIQKFVLAFIAVIMAVVLLYSMLVQAFFIDILKEAHTDYNHLSIKNISGLVENQITNIINLGFQTYFDTDVNKYIEPNYTNREMKVMRDRIRYYESLNLYIKDIYIYRIKNDVFLSKSGLLIDEAEADAMRELMVKANGKKLCVFRKDAMGSSTTGLYTFVIFPYNNSKEAVLINAYKNLFSKFVENPERHFVFDRNGDVFINYSKNPVSDFKSIVDDINASNIENGNMTITVSGTKYLAIYQKNSDYVYLNVIPYTEFSKQIYSALSIILIAMLVLIPIIYIVLAYFKYLLYNMVYGIISEVKELKSTLSNYRKNHSETILSAFIKHSDTYSEKDYEGLITQNSYRLSVNEKLALIIIEIDDFSLFTSTLSVNAQRALIFGIKNILYEVLNCELTSINNNDIVVLCNTDFEKIKGLASKIEYIQKIVSDNLNITFSACIKGPIDNYKVLSNELNSAFALSDYRFFKGRNTLIDYDYDDNKETIVISTEEKKLNKLIIQRKKDDAMELFKSILEKLKNTTPANYRLMLIQLILNIGHVMNEITGNKLSIDFSNVMSVVENSEFCTEADAAAIGFFADAMIGLDGESADKHKAFVDAAVTLIENQYSNPNLCREYIANHFRMSAKYANHIFAQYTMKSIPQFILEYRLQKGAELLENTDLQINQITEKIGFVNTGHFIQKFKKQYGLTPLEYKKRHIANGDGK